MVEDHETAVWVGGKPEAIPNVAMATMPPYALTHTWDWSPSESRRDTYTPTNHFAPSLDRLIES